MYLIINNITFDFINQWIQSLPGTNRQKLTFKSLLSDRKPSVRTLATNDPELKVWNKCQPSFRIEELNLTRRDQQ